MENQQRKTCKLTEVKQNPKSKQISIQIKKACCKD